MKPVKRKVVVKVKLGPVNRIKWCLDEFFATCFNWRPFGIYIDEKDAGVDNINRGLGAMTSIINSVESGVKSLEIKTIENADKIREIEYQQEEISQTAKKGATFAKNMRALMENDSTDNQD